MVALFCSQVLEFNHIDCPLAIGYMLALPKRQAYDAFRRTIRYSSDDYGRYITSKASYVLDWHFAVK